MYALKQASIIDLSARFDPVVTPVDFDTILFAQKAEKKTSIRTPPPWFRDSTQLKLLLGDAWGQVSVEWSHSLIEAAKAGDTAKINELLKEAKALGIDMVSELGDAPEAIFSNLLAKAEAFWVAHAVDIGISETKFIAEKFRERMAIAQGKQVKAFVRTFPERILHPEIQRQISLLTETDRPDAVMIAHLADQLETFTANPTYWTGLSDTAVARNWHASGILYADKNGIRTGRITGPLDKRTCGVCRHMLGLPVEIADAKAKIENDLFIEDPEKYVEAWKFPRVPDVDNISREELQGKGFLPPYHCRCRHGIAWLYEAVKFDEGKHRRKPKGSSEGGEFAPKEMTADEKSRLQTLVRQNAEYGVSREKAIRAKLESIFSADDGYKIHEQCYLCDLQGRRLVDPKTDKMRRVDIVVIKGDRVIRSVEVTSKKAEKYSQMAKERRIRENNAKVYVLLKGGDVAWIPSKVKTRVWRTEDFHDYL